jgi:hypothetical protein
MTQKLTQVVDSSADVAELLAQRSTLLEWLDRLEAQRAAASERIVARVRADYERRLRETVEALTAHRDAVTEAMQSARVVLEASEQAHESAVDELEEARLRNSIGELADAAWSERRSGLETRVEEAGGREEAARRELDRLQLLLDELDDRPEVPPAPDSALPEMVAAPAPDPPPAAPRPIATPAKQAAAAPAAQAFLADIDRALTDAEGKPQQGASGKATNGDAAEPAQDTAPRPGLKCGECGYTNDLSAWFCGVCGAEIG